MYVCICKGVTDTAIREAVCQGACRMRDLKACLGVSAQCGKCACHAKAVLEDSLLQSKMGLSHQSVNQPIRFYEAAA
ncbi:MAG: bacterioferritin-associated ferredoxin [Sulfuriferula sp.]|nr:bacterioferritin-associated ferredoxin [Sulfuriferula sp.]